MCRDAGHGGNSAVLALDMSLPAATQLRQHALGLHLRRALPGACASTGAGARSGAGASDAPWAPGGFVTDLKTAVRLALGGALAAALGAQLASDAPVREGSQKIVVIVSCDRQVCAIGLIAGRKRTSNPVRWEPCMLGNMIHHRGFQKPVALTVMSACSCAWASRLCTRPAQPRRTSYFQRAGARGASASTAATQCSLVGPCC